MAQILGPGQRVQAVQAGVECEVKQFIGAGGQGEVYKAELGGQDVALKWYNLQYLGVDLGLRERILNSIKSGPPSDRFLWPMDLVTSKDTPGFGYVMPLREDRFKSLTSLMKRSFETTFQAMATAGFELADSFLKLHAPGLCYRDISFGNVFFDPSTGDIRICDNDNVDTNRKEGGILGTPMFMAPEIVRGEASPTRETDLFSLSVLLFFMLFRGHPLEGEREYNIHVMDDNARTRLFGTDPVFIFDPGDTSNRPVKGWNDYPVLFWDIYPTFIRNIFTTAFTKGLKDPGERVKETDWCIAMTNLRDSIVYCPYCKKQNFYDPLAYRKSGGKELPECWACKKEIRLPYRIRIEKTGAKSVVMLNYDKKLFPHHVDPKRKFDFSSPVAEIVLHPKDPSIWGLKNLSDEQWSATAPEGKMRDIPPGRSIPLQDGLVIHFGKAEGTVAL